MVILIWKVIDHIWLNEERLRSRSRAICILKFKCNLPSKISTTFRLCEIFIFKISGLIAFDTLLDSRFKMRKFDF